MERWRGKVAAVTGASSGIGAAITKELLNAGVRVVGLARRENLVEALKADLPENLRPNLHVIKCDVGKETEIVDAFRWIEENLGGVDILVNNAGVIKQGLLSDANNSEAVRDNVEINFLGYVFCTREALKSMKSRNVDGHVLFINSIWGHHVPNFKLYAPQSNVYCATKFATTGLVETLRQEMLFLNKKIKVTSISPGPVNTGRLQKHFSQELLRDILQPQDIAKYGVLYALATPPHVSIQELTINAVTENL